MKDPAKEPWYYGVLETIIWVVPILGTLIYLFHPEVRKKHQGIWWASLIITVSFCAWLGYMLLLTK